MKAAGILVVVEEGWVSASMCDALGSRWALTTPNKVKLQRKVLVAASCRRTIMSEERERDRSAPASGPVPPGKSPLLVQFARSLPYPLGKIIWAKFLV